jgi:predicted dithiol-disulfide oxidoreductase (DUF899 family)
MADNRVVSHHEWLAARQELLTREKEFTRLRDELSRRRRELPWERVTKDYVFATKTGRRTLAELFDGRSQLIVQHLMFGPDWEAACKSCSFWADSFNGIVPHLEQRDVSFVAVSRAPLAKLQAFAQRLGWTFNWVSSAGNDFNFDYGVSFKPDDLEGEIVYNYTRQKAQSSELPGVSVFAKDASGGIFHTYSCYGRGLDPLNSAYQLLDLVPKGRDEAGLPYPMAWVRLHDQYAGATR